MALMIMSKPEVQAKWVDYKDGDNVVAKFLINPIDDMRYQVALERNQLSHRADGFEIDDIGNESRPWFEKDAEATARYLIVDWQGLVDGDGKEIAYSPIKALEILTKSKIGLVLWSWVKAQAELIQSEAYKEAEETVKKP